MDLFENTLIIATVVAVVIYIWMHRSKNSPQDAVPTVDVDERRRRREHFAKVAENRVAAMAVAMQENNPVSLDSGRLKEKLQTGERTNKESKSQTNSSKETQKKTEVAASTSGSSYVNMASKKTSDDTTSPSVSDSLVENNLSKASASESAKSVVNKDCNTLPDVVESAAMDPVGHHNIKASYSPASDTSSIKLDQNTTKREENQAEAGPISTDPITLYLLLTSFPSTPKLSLTISPSFTATKLRSLASEATNVLITDARLIYRGKVISDSMQCVGDYGLHDGSVLHLVGKPRNKVVRDESPNESNNAISLDFDTAAVNHGSASIESTDEIDIGSNAEFNNNQNDATI
eukprot:scaffold25398_cov65-Cyclotella_meneghiniana.AAC.2